MRVTREMEKAQAHFSIQAGKHTYFGGVSSFLPSPLFLPRGISVTLLSFTNFIFSL